MSTRWVIAVGWFLVFCAVFAVQDSGGWRAFWIAAGIIVATSATTYTFVRKDTREQALSVLHIRRKDHDITP